MKLTYDIIADKRDGKVLSDAEIKAFLEGYYAAGTVTDYQMAALLMAVCIRGLSVPELHIWTDTMLHSGEVMKWPGLPGPVVDKHSTGGVGDKISLPLAPLLGSLGFKVPMISGRGLGHTGGTLDKLESIPNFNVNLTADAFRTQMYGLGVALIGQTPEIAPLDKKLYSLRDVTGTVESIPLISSSIMSKKLAEGISTLLLDVKYGKAAFMKDKNSACLLAETMKQIGSDFGVDVLAVITRMDEPLGKAVGNALEIKESIEVLKGKWVSGVTELTIAMAVALLKHSGKALRSDEAEEMVCKKLANGDALAFFADIIAAQGGDPDVISDYSLLPQSKYRREVRAASSGYVTEIDGLCFGKSLVLLGGARKRKEDSINPAVGYVFEVSVGDTVSEGDLLYTIHYDEKDRCADTMAYCRNSIKIGDMSPEVKPLIVEWV